MLETAPQRFERVQLCYPISSHPDNCCGCHATSATFGMAGLLHMVSADVAVIRFHAAHACNVIHKTEQLGLRLGLLRKHLMLLPERRHVWSIVCKSEDDVLAKVIRGLISTGRTNATSYQSEKHKRIIVCDIEGCKHYEWTFPHVEVVALMLHVSLVPIGDWNIFNTDERLWHCSPEGFEARAPELQFATSPGCPASPANADTHCSEVKLGNKVNIFLEAFASQSQSRSFEDKQSFQCVSKDTVMLWCIEMTLQHGALWRAVNIKPVFELFAVKQRLEKLFETELGLQ